MNYKKWLAVFFTTLFVTTGGWALFNFLVDPFGVFGDPLLNYSEYSMTQNPRVAKIGWLDKHHEDYDSYVIGCSKSSSIPTDALNSAFDASFYNMIMYGGDLYDIEKTVEYVLENYTAKNIVVVIGLEETHTYNTEADPHKGNLHAKVDGSPVIPFYFKHLFLNPEYGISKIKAYRNSPYLITPDEVFIKETGTYNKSRRDAAKIPLMKDYLAENPSFSMAGWKESTKDADKCLESIERIRNVCLEKGAKLTLITSPVYKTELEMYNSDELIRYFEGIAEITPFWNFSGYTSISSEARYFYDYAHFRNCVGEMMIARISGSDDFFVPENFGQYVTKDNAHETLKKAFTQEESQEELSKRLPVLMYHHFVNEPDGTDAVSAARFEEHLTALESAGYTCITLEDVVSYTKNGTPLPNKPILLTIDDGYSSNIEIAAPILQSHSASAVIAVIGCSIGHDTYKDSDKAITPHFALEDALDYVENGTLTVISHTWDMHQVEGLDKAPVRHGSLPLENETEEEYLRALERDFEKIKTALESAYGKRLYAVAYPHGEFTELSEVFYSQNGIDITFTTKWETNEILKGFPQSARLLSRFAVDGNVTGERLLEIIESAE